MTGFPGRSFFWGPVGFDHWGFQVKCVPGYWELTLRNRDRLGLRGHRGEESRVFHWDLLSPLGIGAESKEGLWRKVYYKAGYETRGLDLEK